MSQKGRHASSKCQAVGGDVIGQSKSPQHSRSSPCISCPNHEVGMRGLLRPAASHRSSWLCPRCQQSYVLLDRARAVNITSDTVKRKLLYGQRRYLHESSSTSQQQEPSSQAQPLGDFYSDLLNHQIPKSSKATSSPSLPTFVRSGDETKEERAKKLFGNLKGSGYERTVSDKPDANWRTLNGVPVPPRPGEPDNCCMSGCVHCVWDDFRDDVEQWAQRVREAQAKGGAPTEERTSKAHMARPEVASASSSMDDDGGGSEALWTTPSPPADEDALFAEIPVGIREFMATEKRIRDRKRARKQKSR